MVTSKSGPAVGHELDITFPAMFIGSFATRSSRLFLKAALYGDVLILALWTSGVRSKPQWRTQALLQAVLVKLR
jgi:hypothetical protein